MMVSLWLMHRTGGKDIYGVLTQLVLLVQPSWAAAETVFFSSNRPGGSKILLVRPSAHAQRCMRRLGQYTSTRSAKIKYLGHDVVNRSPTHITACT